MNKLTLTLILVLSAVSHSASALTALTPDGDDSSADLYYLSWCSKDNKVLTQTEAGQIIEKENCASKGLACQEFEVKRPHVHQIYAICK